MNHVLTITQIMLSSFVFGAVLCMVFVFRPIVEGLIADEKEEESIRALEKLKLDTWIRYNHWGIVATGVVIAVQLIQLIAGTVSILTIALSCSLLALLIWNQIVDKKLLDLTPTVPTIAIVTDKGDRIWEFYHDQAPILGVVLMLLSLALIVVHLF